MKNKKIVILLGVVGFLLVLAIILFFVLQKKNSDIEIYFNSDGGTIVEKIIIKKGESISLPNVIKEGYQFVGWYDGDYKVSDSTRFNETTTLYAKWIEEDAKTYTITFDSDGGTAIDNLVVECDTELKLPLNPTKKGYEFVSWVDKNETVILDKAILSCEDVTLKATWKKVEEKKTETKEEPKTQTKTTEPVKEVTYTCPTGYKLNGTKCEFDDIVREKCPDGTYEYEGKCVTVNNSVRKESVKTCGTKVINTGGGYTPTVQGELFQQGTYFCYYQVVNDSYEQQSSANCSSRGHKWNSVNNKCYYDRDNANVNITYTCSDSNYIYIGNPNQFEGVNGLNGGCYPTTSKVKYCFDGWTLQDNSSRCVKTINATAN